MDDIKTRSDGWLIDALRDAEKQIGVASEKRAEVLRELKERDFQAPEFSGLPRRKRTKKASGQSTTPAAPTPPASEPEAPPSERISRG